MLQQKGKWHKTFLTWFGPHLLRGAMPRERNTLDRIKKYKHNLTYAKKESLFTLVAIVFVVMLLTIMLVPLSYLTPSFLNFLQSFSQPSQDYTCLTCLILPPQEHSTKGFFSHRIYKCPHTRNIHTQMNNNWSLHKEHLQKDLENPIIFPKSKRDSKNYNV